MGVDFAQFIPDSTCRKDFFTVVTVVFPVVDEVAIFGPPKGRSYDFRSVSQSVTRFKENRSKKFFEIWHEGRGLLVGKSDVGGFLSKTQIFPKFRILSQN